MSLSGINLLFFSLVSNLYLFTFSDMQLNCNSVNAIAEPPRAAAFRADGAPARNGGGGAGGRCSVARD
jgi:hypothetical protein